MARAEKNLTMIHYFQFATKPLGEEASHILPNRQGLWDTGSIMFNIRRDQFDRLLIGSMGKVIGDKDSGLSARCAQTNYQDLSRVVQGQF